MAAQFCVKCGKSLPAEAQFCSGCGNPVPGSASGTALASAPSAAPGSAPPPPEATAATAPPAGPPLGSILGLAGSRNFLLQHQLLSNGRNYRVLDREKRHLFTVKEDRGQELMANVLHRSGAPQLGFHMGRLPAATVTLLWRVADASGTPRGTITIQVTGNSAVSTLTDSAGTPVLAVNVERSMIGGLNATAAFPDGRPMFATQGNLLRHNFSIRDPSGGEVAKIHEAWASLRDTYNLDIVGDVDPLCPLVFAILIDREKESG